MPLAQEWAMVAQSQVPDSRHDEEGSHEGGLARAECNIGGLLGVGCGNPHRVRKVSSGVVAWH